MSWRTHTLMALALLAACGQDEQAPAVDGTLISRDGGSTRDGRPIVDDGATEDEGAPHAPRVLSFAASPTRVGGPATPGAQGGSVSFILVATDPDGIGDLIGGSLLDETGELTYASLATGADEGSYSTTLSWSAINDVLPIELVDEEVRTFRARIFDQSGALAEATARVTLHCGGDAACAGVCVDLQANTDNCGACGRACPGGSVCDAGRCQRNVCVFVIGAGTDSCDAACAEAKLACQPCSETSAAVGSAYASGACAYYSDDPAPLPIASCTTSLASTNAKSASCCCASAS